MTARDDMRPTMWVCRLGAVSYRDGLQIQRHVQALRQAGEISDTLLLLEHDPPVYTRGRRSSDGELSLGEDFYRAQGIEIVATDRGGRVTYHGPGQLVGYPIMAVGDVIAHLRLMESAIVAALAEVGIEARSRWMEGPDWTGVWVGERKIASIGVHVSRGVSTHGFALNVLNDLSPFTWIVPCGLSGVSMTSVAQEMAAPTPARRAQAADVDRLGDRVAAHLCALSGHRAEPVELARIQGAVPA